MHMTAKRTNLASNVVIEELSDVEDILCVTFSADDTFAYDASLNVYSQDMCITKNDLVDALLTVNDALAQTWIVDSRCFISCDSYQGVFFYFYCRQPWPCIPWKQSHMLH